MAIKFGKGGKSKKGGLAIWWKRLRALLSGIAVTLSLLTFLMALSQVLIHAMATSIFDEDNFQDWWSAPLLPFLFSIVFLIIFLILNYDRIPILRDIAPRLKGVKAPRPSKELELPEFD